MLFVTFSLDRIIFIDRKLQKTEGQRRSPRLSTLVIEAHDCLDNEQGPAFRTRGKKNTKLRPPRQLKPSKSQVLFFVYVTFFTPCLILILVHIHESLCRM